ncbi:MAG: triple tyrosine motif-containing protein [Blastocatellia bacterium]
MRFKYQLVGLDQDWVEAGTRRTAYYSHLPPGEYTFKVIAENGEGVWNQAGQSLRIIMLPPCYRTWWFVLLAALSLAALVVLAWQWRVRQLRKVQRAQQAFSHQLIASQEAERKRIAAELHDGLGQRLVIIKNLAFISSQAPHCTDDVRQQIEEISAETSAAISEVREISYNLRPYQLDRIGLTKAIESIIRTAHTASDITFTASLDPIDDVFPKEAEINFYRLVQESINNILKHSQATKARLLIQRRPRQLQLTIHDNGKGFVPGAPKADGQRGGFGLLGIAERAHLLGGKPTIHSTPGQGTTINIEINLEKLHEH